MLVKKLVKFHPPIFNPIALRKAKIVYNFGLSECNRVKFNDTGHYNILVNSRKTFFIKLKDT